ncbi:DUF6884 domain-containing protein [Tolypothrix sp. PCC 7601]|uniref:DUF6884 domain-containing protein n=1 Tax=Tolypothrix sp. PCC 7601 TaxID=1188 RepID=UPI000A3F55C8|nr:DUF6884 domain-containing protein [Tolypothrix sp. PCC 7601]
MKITKSPLTKTLVSTSTISRLRTLIITSCTGKKLHNPTNQLTIEDFKDTKRLRERTQSLSEFSCSACQMYTGLQHLRLMEGVDILRSRFGKEVVDVKIISAGYGLIPEDKVIVPYSVTFNSMKSDEISSWANFIGIHKDFQETVIGYDLVFVLLGDKYLRALNLPVETHPKQTFIILASNKSRNLVFLEDTNFELLTFSNADASRFGCALVGLKGQLLKLIASESRREPNLLSELYNNPKILEKVLNNQPQQLELPLEITSTTSKKTNINKKSQKQKKQ